MQTMKIIWNWLKQNSEQIRGLAAIVTIVALLIGVPFAFYKWLKPDLEITVRRDPPSISTDLRTWISDTKSALQLLPQATAGEPDPFERFRPMQSSGPLRNSRAVGVTEYEAVRIELNNRSNGIISGVRIRLENARITGGVEVSSNSLTTRELSEWQMKLPTEATDTVLVLPELPPLPPQSTVRIIAYGGVAYTDVSASVTGGSVQIIRLITVKDAFPISALMRPYWVPAGVLVLLVVVLWAYLLIESRILKRARRTIPYDLACEEAKAGRNTNALALLRAAIACGYNDFDHLRQDDDLVGLRKMEAFKKLVSPEQPKAEE
mgnify:CR=1 FL=1